MTPDQIHTIRTHIEHEQAAGRPGAVPGEEVLALIAELDHQRDRAEQAEQALAAAASLWRKLTEIAAAAHNAAGRIFGKPGRTSSPPSAAVPAPPRAAAADHAESLDPDDDVPEWERKLLERGLAGDVDTFVVGGEFLEEEEGPGHG